MSFVLLDTHQAVHGEVHNENRHYGTGVALSLRITRHTNLTVPQDNRLVAVCTARIGESVHILFTEGRDEKPGTHATLPAFVDACHQQMNHLGAALQAACLLGRECKEGM